MLSTRCSVCTAACPYLHNSGMMAAPTAAVRMALYGCCTGAAHSLIMLKQRLLGSGLMPKSVSALLMMVVIWPRKNRTLVGSTAPSWEKTVSRALRSCAAGQPRAWGQCAGDTLTISVKPIAVQNMHRQRRSALVWGACLCSYHTGGTEYILCQLLQHPSTSPRACMACCCAVVYSGHHVMPSTDVLHLTGVLHAAHAA